MLVTIYGPCVCTVELVLHTRLMYISCETTTPFTPFSLLKTNGNESMDVGDDGFFWVFEEKGLFVPCVRLYTGCRWLKAHKRVV